MSHQQIWEHTWYIKGNRKFRCGALLIGFDQGYRWKYAKSSRRCYVCEKCGAQFEAERIPHEEQEK